jgi:hypothetical protein
LNKGISLAHQGSSFESAWRPYHDSFDDNQKEVLDGIREAFIKNVQSVSPLNLNSTVGLFKELGRQEEAAELLKSYIDQHVAT